MENLRMPASYATLPEEERRRSLAAENWEMHWTALRITSTWTISSFRGDPLHFDLVCASAPVQCCCFRLPVCRKHLQEPVQLVRLS